MLTSLAQTRFEMYSAAQSFTDPAGLFAGDIDNDGDQDILAASGTHGVIVLYNEGGDPIQWVPEAVDASLGASLTVHMADVDGDGNQDILTGGWDSDRVVWYRNAGDHHTWQKKTISTSVDMPHEVWAYDLDQDGDQDVLVSGAGDNSIAWFRNNDGSGTSWTPQIVSDHFMGSRSVAAGDFDQDGKIDLTGASLDGNEITIWRNLGGDPLVWEEITLDNQFTGSHRVQVMDMNADGKLDIIGTAYAISEISWWQNPGTVEANWEKHIIDGELTGAVIGTAVDLDHDGDLDMIGTGQPGNIVTWYENTGDEARPWTKTVITDQFGGAWPLCVGDFNNDLTMDFAVGGNSANEIRVFNNIQEGRLNRVAQLNSGDVKVGLFIPPGQIEATKLMLTLAYCDDPYSYSRLRDMLIGLSENEGISLMVTEALNSGSPGYQAMAPADIEAYIAYAIAHLNIYPDSIYIVGMACNGLPVVRFGESLPTSVLGVIPFNPRVPTLFTGDFEGYPDLPLCLCSGANHIDRSRHEELVSRVANTAQKAWLNDLPGVGEDVLVGNLVEELTDCMNYIDTVRGGTSSAPVHVTSGRLSVYPNPTNGVVNYFVPNGFVVENVSVVNLLGEVIEHLQVVNSATGQDHRLDLSGLEKGLYCLIVQGSGKRLNKKILIQ